MKKKNEILIEHLSKVIGGLFLTLVGMISYFYLNGDVVSSIKLFVLVFGIIGNIILLLVFLLVYKFVLDKID